MLKVISLDTLREERRKQTLETPITYIGLDGRPRTVMKRIVNGEMVVLELGRPIGEMITTPAGLDALVQKTVIDLELGREQVPLLYGPIYRTVEDENMTEFVDVKPFTVAQVVFLEHAEFEEVRFGSRKVGPKDTVPIITFAAGLRWTEDMVEYDKTWEMTESNRAMGEAYNALLNHIHLSPIIEYTYPAKNKTAAVVEGANYVEKVRSTLKAALKHAGQDKNTDTKRPRRPRICLAHSSMQMDIEEALQRIQVGGTVYPPLSQIDTLVLYDGWTETVGERTYTYPGVDPGKCYLVDPKKYFVELVKHGLRVDATGADLTKLVANAIVGRTRRGVIAAPANAVEEVTLPQ